MASVSGVSTSNSSSLYGTRNVLSGLATGLDTESMIENAVSGYNTKISSLQQKQTKLTWEQEAYRDITDPMVQFSRKYTSYTSSTNLYSASFFNNAVTTTTNGANAAMVSATGKTSSDVQILGIKQLATASAYRVSASDLLGGTVSGEAATITGSALDLTATQALSNVAGTLTLTYGSSRTMSLSFDDLETYSDVNAFADAINTKLGKITLSNSDGDIVSASTMVKATVDGSGNIVFSDNQDAGNSVAITDATGKIKTTLGIDPSAGSDTLNTAGVTLTAEDTTVGDYLSGKTLSVTVDGQTKTITLPEYDGSTDDFIGGLNTSLQAAFGTGVSAEKMTGLDGSGDPYEYLQITGQAGSTISISATDSVGTALGLSGGTATSYLDVGKTLEDLLGTGVSDTGNVLTINGVTIGTYAKDTALESILSDIK